MTGTNPAPRFTATNNSTDVGSLYQGGDAARQSCSPSVESYTLALQQKYSFVELPQPAKEVRPAVSMDAQAFEEDGV